MKLSLFVAVALLGCVAAVSLTKGALQPRFAEIRNQPADSQNFRDGEDAIEGFEHRLDPTKSTLRHTDSKFTPGANCIVFKTCKECGTAGHKAVADNRICTWVPDDPHADERDYDETNDSGESNIKARGKQYQGVCVSSRNPVAQTGEKLNECTKVHSPEIVDSNDDEDDDLSELHVNGNPNEVDIAVLGKAEPVYTTAQELGAGEGPESEAAGDWIQKGYSRQEYEGYVDASMLDAANQDFAHLNDAYVGSSVFVSGTEDSDYVSTGSFGSGLDYTGTGTVVDTTTGQGGATRR